MIGRYCAATNQSYVKDFAFHIVLLRCYDVVVSRCTGLGYSYALFKLLIEETVVEGKGNVLVYPG